MSTDAELIALVAEARDFSERMTAQPWACELIDRLADALEAARADEREACARLADDMAADDLALEAAVNSEGRPVDGMRYRWRAKGEADAAAAIRNRTPSPPAEEKKT